MTKRILTSTAFVLMLASCVTINVYFPAVAAERAADRIIDDVWGPRTGEAPSETAPAADNGADASRHRPVATVLALIDFIVPAAHAAEPDIDISSPAIRRIVDAMESRHADLKPYYDSGAIGLTRQATIAVRDQAAVPLSERNRLKQLVAAENEDRNALYREIAVANGHPEWEDQIRTTFAERWIRKARSGWYYQTADGGWTQKR